MDALTPRRVRTLAALLLCALAGTAQAGLTIESFYAFAGAGVNDSRSAPLSDSEDSIEPNALPFVLSGTVAEPGGAFATAMQTKGGFFANHAGANLVDYGADYGENASTSTEYTVVVGTDTANTPLRLSFTFVGSRAYGDSRYGYGQVTAGVAASISAGRVTDPLLAHTGGPIDLVWEFVDRMELDGTGQGFARRSNGTDVFAVGLPQLSETYGWIEFYQYGEARRDAFSATLDFGLLQPGEYFAFSYVAEAWADGHEVPYTGHADAMLVDPFSLAAPPPSMIALEGLALPTSPVPEPAGGVLALAGALLLFAWSSRSRRAAAASSGGARMASNAA